MKPEKPAEQISAVSREIDAPDNQEGEPGVNES